MVGYERTYLGLFSVISLWGVSTPTNSGPDWVRAAFDALIPSYTRCKCTTQWASSHVSTHYLAFQHRHFIVLIPPKASLWRLKRLGSLNTFVLPRLLCCWYQSSGKTVGVVNRSRAWYPQVIHSRAAQSDTKIALDLSMYNQMWNPNPDVLCLDCPVELPKDTKV